jgi:hypothetical protein
VRDVSGTLSEDTGLDESAADGCLLLVVSRGRGG